MLRVLGPVVLGLIVLAVWLYGIVDVLSTQRSVTRTLPKWLWVPLVLLVPFVGAAAWLSFGRPRDAGLPPGGDPDRGPPTVLPPAPLGIEDTPEWERARRVERAEAERRERARRRRGGNPDGGPPGDDGGGGTDDRPPR